MDQRKKYLQNLPRKIIACGLLIFNNKNELLILKPSYKDAWGIPGGVVEALESPLVGLKREIFEEIGIKISINNIHLSIIDFTIKDHNNYKCDTLQLIFSLNNIKPELINKIKIDNKEIVDFQFAPIKKAYKLLDKKLSKRIRQLINNDYSFVMLNNGNKNIFST